MLYAVITDCKAPPDKLGFMILSYISKYNWQSFEERMLLLFFIMSKAQLPSTGNSLHDTPVRNIKYFQISKKLNSEVLQQGGVIR